jgi:phosphoglycolate phosphatase-like HAD superfamily hydrolase
MPTLLIGDSDRDILSAQKNKLKVLAVATGHHDIEELRRLNPNYLLGSDWSAQEFLEIISRFAENIDL